MNVARFLVHFPEFRETDTDFIDSKLIEAAVRMGGPSDLWGSFAAPGQPSSQADMAQGNLAAHYLVASPMGTPFRLDPKSKGRSIYLDKFEELQLALCGPIIFVAGGC